MKKKEEPFYASEYDCMVYSQTYQIPFDLVEIIFSLKRIYSPTFFGWLFCDCEQILPYTKSEYDNMFLGISIAFKNQHLMGTALPQNDELVIKINKFLVENGCAIQYHPQHGMQIVRVEKK